MKIEIEKKDVERKISALSTLLKTMDIPDSRRDLAQMSNIRWLNRNLRVKNADNPMIDSTMEVVAFILRKHYLLRHF